MGVFDRHTLCDVFNVFPSMFSYVIPLILLILVYLYFYLIYYLFAELEQIIGNTGCVHTRE